MLDVHHRAYLRNTDPWNYPNYALITFCQAHHKIEQNRMEEAHMAIARNPVLIEYCIEHGKLEAARTIRWPETATAFKPSFDEIRKSIA